MFTLIPIMHATREKLSNDLEKLKDSLELPNLYLSCLNYGNR